MTEKRFKVAVYDDKAINGFAVLDLQKPNSSKRLEYENVYIGSKEGCEIVCNFGNSLADENNQLKQSVNNLKDTILKITVAYHRKYDRTIVDLVDEVHDEDITDLIKELQRND